jgi:transposase
MHTQVYNTQRWRDLPRDYCLVGELLGDAGGPCRGLIHHHHVDPTDPDSRTVPVCNSHHGRLHGVLNRLNAAERRRCTHRHLYPGAREACERRLNRAA